MPSKAFLHPGPPKTGTTYLQGILAANVDALRAQAVAVVGYQGLHYRAASELTGRKPRRAPRVPENAWARVLGLLAEQPGRAVMSSERYSLAGPPAVRRISTDVDATHELHVVLTLRDLTQSVPSFWQESIKNGSATSWSDYCRAIATQPRLLRRATRAHRVLQTWTSMLPPERIHVVTVPPPGADPHLLLERFAQVTGIDTGRLATLTPKRSNSSMDLVGTELLRRLNASPEVTLTPRDAHSELKRFLAEDVLSQRRRLVRAVPTHDAFTALREESLRIVGLVEEHGFPVVGDLADLTRAAEPDHDSQQGFGTEELLDDALQAIGALAQRSARRGRRINHLLASQRASGPPPRWRGALRRLAGAARS